MRYLSNILALTIFWNVYSQKNHIADDKIIWNENILKWSDFKGLIPERRAFNDTLSDGAGSSLGIYKFVKFRGDSIFLNIYSWFNKTKSWTIDSTIEGLKHEQTHFDIAEIYARELKKRVLNYGSKDITTVLELLDKTSQEINKEYNQMQRQYDDETFHSLNKFIQTEWNCKIRRKLVLLDEYKKIDVFIFTINHK